MCGRQRISYPARALPARAQPWPAPTARLAAAHPSAAPWARRPRSAPAATGPAQRERASEPGSQRKPALPQAVRPSVHPAAPRSLRAYLPPAPGGPHVAGPAPRQRQYVLTPERRCCAAPLPEACQASGRLAAERAGPASSGGRGQGARDGPVHRARARARCDRAGVRQSRPGCRAPADCTPRCVVSA